MNDSNVSQRLMKFLLNKKFYLPLDYDTLKNEFGYIEDRDNFIESMGYLFDSYLEELKTVRENEFFTLDADDIEECKKLCDSILACLRNYYLYYLGNNEEALKTLSETLDSEPIRERLKNLTTIISKLDDYFLFRIRMDEEVIEEYEMALKEGKPLDWKHIFHVPFSKRRLIKNCRYSLAGVPCLYLASSVEVCLIETITEASRDVFASYFKLKREGGGKLLNFSYTPQHLGFLLMSDKEKIKNSFITFQWVESLSTGSTDKIKTIIKAYVVCYPLIASASVRVNNKHENRHFKPEYIIPQLLMQWLRREDRNYYGIKYFSTKKLRTDIELIDDRIRNFWNYAFPIREEETFEEMEFSKTLRDLFEISSTVSSINFLDSYVKFILNEFIKNFKKGVYEKLKIEIYRDIRKSNIASIDQGIYDKIGTIKMDNLDKLLSNEPIEILDLANKIKEALKDYYNLKLDEEVIDKKRYEDLKNKNYLIDSLEKLSDDFVEKRCKFLKNLLGDLATRDDIKRSIFDFLKEHWGEIIEEGRPGKEKMEREIRKLLEDNLSRTIDNVILKEDKRRKLKPIEQIPIVGFDDFIPDELRKEEEKYKIGAVWETPEDEKKRKVHVDMIRKYSNTLWGAFEGYLINQFEKSAQRDKY